MKMTASFKGSQLLAEKYSRRANLLGSGGMRAVMRQTADDVEAQLRARVDSFTPGAVADLSPKYKERKAARYGHVYPILIGAGALLASMRTRVLQTKAGTWIIRLEFWGQHPSGIRNDALADAHIRGDGPLPPRDFTRLPPAVRAELRARTLEALRRS